MPGRKHVEILLWIMFKLRKTCITVFCDLQTFLAGLMHLKILVQEPVFPQPVWTYILLCRISVFLCTNLSIWREKFLVCIYAVILIFLLPSDHSVNKMSVSHANKLLTFIMYLILFENYWFFILIIQPFT